MALRERIENDLKAALLGRRRFVVDVLRNLKAAILNEEVTAGKRDEGLSDAEIEGVLTREVKRRNESRTMYEANDRQDLADIEQQEIDVLQEYLPAQLSEDEIADAVRAAIAQLEADGPKDMGRVIGEVKSSLGSAADGATIARLTKELLQK